MARGFESKDVEFQQAQASEPVQPRRTKTPEERALATRRQTLELALAQTHAQRTLATVPAHRQMLDGAIASLEDQLRQET
jgi:hypothetical protein